MAQQTRRSSTLALDTLSHLASTCYGPAGRSKIVRANASGGGLTVTSTSHKLFSALVLHEPIAKVVLELLVARQAKGADGGLFTVLLTTGLLRGAWRSSLPPRVTAALVPEALARCAVYARCGSLAGQLRISHLPTLLAVVRGVLAPKHVALPAGDAAALQPAGLRPTACAPLAFPSLASLACLLRLRSPPLLALAVAVRPLRMALSRTTSHHAPPPAGRRPCRPAAAVCPRRLRLRSRRTARRAAARLQPHSCGRSGSYRGEACARGVSGGATTPRASPAAARGAACAPELVWVRVKIKIRVRVRVRVQDWD